MDYILYFMLELWNNTQTLELTKIKVFHTYTHTSDLWLVILAVWNMYLTCYMIPYFDLTVLSYPNYFLVCPFFMHLEYIKDYTYLLAFTTTVLLSLNYLKFANKSKILPFRSFHWLTKITLILDRGVYLERLNEYLKFLRLFYLCKIEI